MLRCSHEVSCLTLILEINIEMNRFIAIYTSLVSMSLHIFLCRMTAENAIVLSPVAYVQDYELKLCSSIRTC